jgi:polyisoprenoid-binding protein YceI
MTEMMTTGRLGPLLSDLAGTWTLDPAHTSVEISVRHMMVATVRGRMQARSGTLHIDGDDPLRSWVEVEMDAASIDTGNADRDAHLRSADFLDVDNHPTLHFRSISIDEQPGGTYSICGDLTIRGVTRPTVLQAEFGGAIRDPYGLDRMGFSATTGIDRSEFGLTWNAAMEGGGLVLSDRMKAAVDAEFTRKPAA